MVWRNQCSVLLEINLVAGNVFADLASDGGLMESELKLRRQMMEPCITAYPVSR